MVEYGDIILDNEDNLLISNGDLKPGDNHEQAIGAIINADPGNFRKWPTLGAGLSTLLAGPLNSRDISAKIQNAANLDGWRVDRVKIDTPNLETVEVTVVEAVKTTDDTLSLI